MSNSKAVVSPTQHFEADQLDRAEYQALETALLQTTRGRNFLTEYLRRNGGDAVDAHSIMIEQGLVAPNANDTDKILQAVEKLHAAVMERQAGGDHARMDILEMAKAIARTRSEISAMRTDGDYDHLSVATGEMDAIVLSTEKATNDILQAAEKIQEVAWRLREGGIDEASCEEIDNNATEIYMACSFQDLTGQRTTKVVRVLQYLEARINSMIEIWGIPEANEAVDTREGNKGLLDERPDAHLLNGPQMQNVALEQDNIDALLGNDQICAQTNDEKSADAKSSSDELASDAAIDEIFNETPSDDLIDEEKLKALFS